MPSSSPTGVRRLQGAHSFDMPIDESHIRSRIDQASGVIASLTGQLRTIHSMAQVICDRLDAGATILTCGNGGSAAEALHMAEEMVGRYRRNRAPRAAICLCADPTTLTCIANDFGFEKVFSRQVEGLARRGDALVVFSTSGNSPNIIAALGAARDAGVATIGLLGNGGGQCAPLCDHALVVDSDDTAHIQEAHQVVLHLMLEAVDAKEIATPS